MTFWWKLPACVSDASVTIDDILYCTVRNVRGFLNSEKLIEILKDRFKTAFWRDLNIEHCVVRDAFDDAFIECKYDCDGRDVRGIE
jgi:hypothetical protein